MIHKTQSTVDLNTADEQVLAKRLKISLRLAKRIIALRPYQSVEQLRKIWGIDSDVLQRILPLVSVHQPEGAPDLKPEVTPNPPDVATQPLESAPYTVSQDAAPREALSQPSEPEWSAVQPLSQPSPKTKTGWKTSLTLVVILLLGAYFRLTGLNWDQNQHQHPDERFVTMVTDQIRGVNDIAAYFDTATSSLNPLKFGSYTYGMLPLFFTRTIAQWVKMDSYDSITLVGRALSGLFDLAAVWLLYLLGKRLYNRRTGLLAAALGAAAVLPIQLSHYYAVDSFSTVFVVASVYFGLQALPIDRPADRLSRSNLFYFGLFGIVVGLAGACKVNTLPVFGVIILAGLAKIVTDRKAPDFRAELKKVLGGWGLAAAGGLHGVSDFSAVCVCRAGAVGVAN